MSNVKETSSMEPELELPSEPDYESGYEADSEPESDTTTETASNAPAEVELETDPNSETDYEADSEPESETTTETDMNSETGYEADSETDSETASQGNADQGVLALAALPPEILQKVMEELPPNTLQRLRRVSKVTLSNVDAYVQHLLDSKELVDDTGQPASTALQPFQALTLWNAGRMQYRDPWRAEAAIANDFDSLFSGTDRPDPRTDFTAELRRAIRAGGPDGQLLQQRLLSYVRTLLRTQRLTGEDLRALPDDVDPQQVLTAWLRGDMIWWPKGA